MFFIYRLTESFPSEEMYGLSTQFRRAAVSIPSNIAEGFIREKKIRFMSLAEPAEITERTLFHCPLLFHPLLNMQSKEE